MTHYRKTYHTTFRSQTKQKFWTWKQTLRTALLILMCMLYPAATVLADDPDPNFDVRCGQQFMCPAYAPQDGLCDNGGGANIAGNPTQTPKWHSNVQPPYYLEAFAIEVLKDVAAKEGVDASKTLTQEHVLLMVAWFWTEGGDIANPSRFNPLNSSYRADASLLGTGGGVFPAYASFDAGVEATTITMTAPLQSRIGAALINPSTTADQVAQAIANYQGTPGNLAWGTNPADLAASIGQTRKNYVFEASTTMGTDNYEEKTGPHVPASQLQYIPSGASASGGGTATAGGGGDACSTSLANCTLNNSGTDAPKTSATSAVGNAVACLAMQELNFWQPPGPDKPPGGPAVYCGKYINGIGKPGGDGAWCEEWCADFVSWLYNQAGYPIQPPPNWRVPAVATIRSIGEGGGKFTWKSSNYTPKPGDIVIHEKGQSDHVNVVVSVNGSTVTMIGGDQGSGPYGGPGSRSDVSYQHANGFFSDDISGYVVPNTP